MREDLSKGLLPEHGETVDPIAMARRDRAKSLPRRFYKSAGIDSTGDYHALVLDGRQARTPARNAIGVNSQEVAQMLAAEWNAQEEFIDPAKMPVTRLVISALDAVAGAMAPTLAEVVKYAGSDLLCYRVVEPETLVDEQARRWDPLLNWCAGELGALLVTTQGVMFVSQPQHALDAIARAVGKTAGSGASAPLRAAALHIMTTLTGSAILALAVAHGRLTDEEAWALAHIDEDSQARTWGQDGEALARRARRWLDMKAASEVIARCLV